MYKQERRKEIKERQQRKIKDITKKQIQDLLDQLNKLSGPFCKNNFV